VGRRHRHHRDCSLPHPQSRRERHAGRLMPHTPEFNARRRELYRKAVLLGMLPREAGHNYSEAQFQRHATEYFNREAEMPVRQELPPHQRQLESGVSPGQYFYHNYYGTYVKVHIRVRTQEGDIERRVFTVVWNDVRRPRYGDIYRAAERYIRENSQRYPVELLSLRWGEVVQVPDRR
jgi:hypothetical protein